MPVSSKTNLFYTVIASVALSPPGFAQRTVMNQAGLAGTDGKITVMAYYNGILTLRA
jgi:hypothetical protein